jgi:hypothetical protein
MGWVSLFWAGAWAMIGATVHIRHAGALVVVCLAVSVFAVGETLWSPVGPALINDLAPEHLRGRYNAAFGLTWGIASALAPLLAGLFLGSAKANLWPFAIALGALIGGAALVSLRLRLTPAEDGRVPLASQWRRGQLVSGTSDIDVDVTGRSGSPESPRAGWMSVRAIARYATSKKTATANTIAVGPSP